MRLRRLRPGGRSSCWLNRGFDIDLCRFVIGIKQPCSATTDCSPVQRPVPYFQFTALRQSREPIAIGNKDLSLAADLGRSLGVDTPIAAFVSSNNQD